MLPPLGSSRSQGLKTGGITSENVPLKYRCPLQGHSGGETALQATASMQSGQTGLLRALSGESHPDAEEHAA